MSINPSQLTLGQYLGQFETLASPQEALMLAAQLAGMESSGNTYMDIDRAYEFLTTLRNTPNETPLAVQLMRPISDFLPASDGSSAARLEMVRSPQTWAGKSSDNLLGYLLRTISSRMMPGQRAGERVYHSDDRAVASALERFQFETIPARADLVERREAFQAEHGNRLNWAADHVSTHIKILPEEIREAYGKITSEIRDLNLKYRVALDALDAVWDKHSNLEPHQRNLQVATVLRQGRREIEEIRHRISTLDSEWQLKFFDGLMAEARRQPTPPSEHDEAAFSKARETFESSAKAHLDFWTKLIAQEPRTAEHKRKNLEEASYRALMHGEGSLLTVMRAILTHAGHPQADDLKAPLTFVWKSQAYRVAHGPGKMTNAERFVERTANQGGLVGEAYNGKRSLEFVDRDIAALGWAVPMMGDFYANFRLAAPAGAELFGHHMPPEMNLIRGGLLALYGTASNPARKPDPRKRRIVSNQNHGDPLDYPAICASRYLLGFAPPSIVAESAFNHIPIMNKVLRMQTGGFLSRGEDEKGRLKRQQFDQVLGQKIDEGRDVALFGTGTRALGEPLASRYSDLSHAGALHNPGEFEIPGSMRGMEVRLAMENEADLRLFATNLHRGGIGEPSIPRGWSGFKGRNVTSFGYPSPTSENGFAAYAGEIRFEDLITKDDLPELTLQGINDLNTSIEWYLMTKAGLHMDAGPRIS